MKVTDSKYASIALHPQDPLAHLLAHPRPDQHAGGARCTQEGRKYSHIAAFTSSLATVTELSLSLGFFCPTQSKTTGTGADIEKKYLQEIGKSHTSLEQRLCRTSPLTFSIARCIHTDTLKKQTKQQQQEYNRLSDELAKATGNVSTKKD